MNADNKNILEKTEALVEITAGIGSTMKNMAHSSEDIKNAVETVAELQTAAAEGVRTVQSEIDRFIL